jgi:exonuclease III
MTGKNKHLSILKLNINALHASVKRHRLANWVKKQKSTICCLQETHLTEKKINIGLESKAGKNVFQANGTHKQAGVATFILQGRLQTEINQKRQ